MSHKARAPAAVAPPAPIQKPPPPAVPRVRAGSQVAAKVSEDGAPDEWILARCTKLGEDGRSFTILDEDAGEGEGGLHQLGPASVIALPDSSLRNPQAPVFNTGQAVLAMYPASTMFYRAYVVKPGQWEKAEMRYSSYIVTFDDDQDEGGFPPPRTVNWGHVVPLPKNFKTTSRVN